MLRGLTKTFNPQSNYFERRIHERPYGVKVSTLPGNRKMFCIRYGYLAEKIMLPFNQTWHPSLAPPPSHKWHSTVTRKILVELFTRDKIKTYLWEKTSNYVKVKFTWAALKLTVQLPNCLYFTLVHHNYGYPC